MAKSIRGSNSVSSRRKFTKRLSCEIPTNLNDWLKRISVFEIIANIDSGDCYDFHFASYYHSISRFHFTVVLAVFSADFYSIGQGIYAMICCTLVNYEAMIAII